MRQRLSFASGRRVLVALVAAAAIPAATADASSVLPLSIPRSVERADCMTSRLANAPGTTTVSYTPASTGAFAFMLHGPAGSDWDLAVFDHATGRRLGGSGAFGSDELVQTIVPGGRALDVQACRISGPASSMPLQVQSVSLRGVQAPATAPVESLVQIKVPQPRLFGLLDALGIDTVEDPSSSGVTAVLHSATEAQVLKLAGFAVTTLVPDLAAQDRAQRADDQAYTEKMRAAGGSPLPSGRTTYRHLEDIQADLKSIVQQHPAIARPVTLPVKTFQGRDTVGVELSSDVNATDDQKPSTFIMGEHHAREWPSEEIPVEFALYLAQGYGTDKEITSLLNHTRVIIVPVINGDGFVASREALDPADLTGDPAGALSLLEGVVINGGTLAYRRKNCDGAIPSPATPCFLQYGVDPNRNYGFGWGGPGASTSVNSQSYRGPGPWSEPETQAVHAFSQVRDITTLITMHNFASLVLRPPGVSGAGLAPDETALKALGDQMGADTGYTSEYGYQLYDTSGDTEDWNYGAAGTYGYTIEMGPAAEDGGNFHIAYQRGVVDQWTGTGQQAGRGLRAALMAAAEEATDASQFSTITGRAPAGRILKLSTSFQTSTSPVCTIASPSDLDVTDTSLTDCIAPTPPIVLPDHLQYTTTVPANGNFSWLVTPSTRPFVYKAGQSESWALTCQDAQGTVYDTQAVTIWRGQKQNFDMPCGGKLPAKVAAPRDRLPPRSHVTKGSLMANRKGLQLAGTAVDFAPAGFEPALARVEVAVGRQTGSRCRFATAKGAFGAPVSCERARYLPADGTATWTFLYRHPLPKGRYLAWVRGVDAVGNHEPKSRARNLVRFTVK